jgi:transcription termination/antitermination protein NusG
MQHTNRTDGGAVGLKTEWFAFRVRGKHEKSVAFHHREKREECFVPIVRTTRRWGKRVAHVELPLFSGYVFCCSERFAMLPILNTPGIVDVIRTGNSPVPVSDAEISAIKRAVNAHVLIERCPYVDVGQRVEVRRGPLTGVIGIVTDRRKNDQLVLSVSLIRCSILVHVDLSDVYDYAWPPIVSEHDQDCLVNTASA